MDPRSTVPGPVARDGRTRPQDPAETNLPRPTHEQMGVRPFPGHCPGAPLAKASRPPRASPGSGRNQSTAPNPEAVPGGRVHTPARPTPLYRIPAGPARPASSWCTQYTEGADMRETAVFGSSKEILGV